MMYDCWLKIYQSIIAFCFDYIQTHWLLSTMSNYYYIVSEMFDYPSHLHILNTTSTTVELQWNPVNCSLLNSSLSDYVVQYGSGLVTTTTINTNSTVSKYTITGLTPFTLYTFQVAGVCGEDNGGFSTAIRLMTSEDSEI